jgi:20S proteasome subunit beta 3
MMLMLLYSDMRLGAQFQTITCDFEKVFQINDKVFVGLTGLASDVLSVEQLLQFKCNLYKLKENRDIKPQAFSAMLSTLLYEKRFGPWFTEPIVAGLSDDNKPFLSGMDLIGAPVFTDDFCVSGTCTANLHGMCESLYRPDMVCPSLNLNFNFI